MTSIIGGNLYQQKNYTPLNPCERTSYAPTNPRSGQSPYVYETVVWNSRSQSSYVYAAQGEEVSWRSSSTTGSSNSNTPTTKEKPFAKTASRVAPAILKPERTPTAVSRYSPDTIALSCGPTAKTVCSTTAFVPYSSGSCFFPTVASSSSAIYGQFNREA